MSKDRKIVYEPHPVSPERKAELLAAGFKIIDAQFDPNPKTVDALRADGPTVGEYVDAGYLAKNYLPEGYASRSTPEEIATAIAAQDAGGKIELGTDSGDQFSDDELRKIIEQVTGQKPHHLLGRAKLVEQFNALNRQAASE